MGGTPAALQTLLGDMDREGGGGDQPFSDYHQQQQQQQQEMFGGNQQVSRRICSCGRCGVVMLAIQWRRFDSNFPLVYSLTIMLAAALVQIVG